MHAALAAWLTAQPWRAVVLAACLSAVPMRMPFAIAAGAIPVLLMLRNEMRMAVLAALAATVVPVLLLGKVAQAAPIVLIESVLWFAVLLGVAWLLRRSGSLNLCFQVAVLTVGLFVIALYLLVDDPAVAVWADFVRARLNEMTRQMQQTGMTFDGDPTRAQGPLTQVLWGLSLASTLASILGTLFLGRWWNSLLEARGSFGAEYRALRLGMVLSLLVTAAFLAAWWSDSKLVASLAWVGGGALFFQGLSAAHRGKASGLLNQRGLTAMYVSLVLPVVMLFPAIVLTAWGFTDTWRQLLTSNV
jgi:hypothetical protein